MKKAGVGLIALILAGSAFAADEVKVTGNRVSLRATPDLNSVLLDRAMNGDTLVLKDESNAEWLGVLPPDSVDLWVHSEFLDEGVVLPERLNIRSGPSLNHSVVGVVQQGDSLTIRGEASGWLRIAPPQTSVVWISRKYAEIVSEPPVESVDAVSQSELSNVIAAASGVDGLPEMLTADSVKTQGREMMLSGVLRPTGGLLRKLVDPAAEDVTVCYVRGNAAQMKELEGQRITILGKAFWALDLDLPFIRPVKIQLSR